MSTNPEHSDRQPGLSTVTVHAAQQVHPDLIAVDFLIRTADGDVGGRTTVSGDGRRVWVHTEVTHGQHPRVLLSHKVDPNDPEDDFAVIAAEVARIREFTMPMPTDDVDRVAAVVHAYVTGARAEWG